MRARALWWVTAVAALALAGCRTAPPVVGDPPPKLQDDQAEAAYQKILQRYSGHDEVYSTFDTQLFAGATFQAWEFREARVKRLALFKAMTEEEVQKALADEKADHEQFNVVEFGTFTRDPKFDDFDTKTSIWRIALVADGVELLPVSVTRVQRANLNTRAIYPYMGEFWVHYRAKFAKAKPDGTPAIPPGTREVLFQIASTLGKAEIKVGAE